MRYVWIGPVTGISNASFLGRFWLEGLIEEGLDIVIQNSNTPDIRWEPSNAIKSRIINPSKEILSSDKVIRQFISQFDETPLEDFFNTSDRFTIPILNEERAEPENDYLIDLTDEKVISSNSLTTNTIKGLEDADIINIKDTITPPYENKWLTNVGTEKLNKRNNIFRIGTIIDNPTKQSGVFEVVKAAIYEFNQQQRVELIVYTMFDNIQPVKDIINEALRMVTYKQYKVLDVSIISYTQQTYLEFIDSCNVLIQVPKYSGFDNHSLVSSFVNTPIIYPTGDKILNNFEGKQLLWNDSFIVDNMISKLGCHTILDEAIDPYWRSQVGIDQPSKYFWYTSQVWSIRQNLNIVYSHWSKNINTRILPTLSVLHNDIVINKFLEVLDGTP